MRLLLTRAVEDAARTRAKLEAAGHTVLVSPVIRFVPIATPWPRSPPHGLIATSAQAFCALAEEAPGWDVGAVPLYFVGRRTEEAARAAGFNGPASVAPNAAALITRLRALKMMRLLYLAGEDRKFDIEDGLADSKHRLAVIETYRAEAADALMPEVRAALQEGSIDGVLHYSRRSASIFMNLTAAVGLDVTFLEHFCLSADVAVALAGCRYVNTAARPDDDAMRALLNAI